MVPFCNGVCWSGRRRPAGGRNEGASDVGGCSRYHPSCAWAADGVIRRVAHLVAVAGSGATRHILLAEADAAFFGRPLVSAFGGVRGNPGLAPFPGRCRDGLAYSSHSTRMRLIWPRFTLGCGEAVLGVLALAVGAVSAGDARADGRRRASAGLWCVAVDMALSSNSTYDDSASTRHPTRQPVVILATCLAYRGRWAIVKARLRRARFRAGRRRRRPALRRRGGRWRGCIAPSRRGRPSRR